MQLGISPLLVMETIKNVDFLESCRNVGSVTLSRFFHAQYRSFTIVVDKNHLTDLRKRPLRFGNCVGLQET